MGRIDLFELVEGTSLKNDLKPIKGKEMVRLKSTSQSESTNEMIKNLTILTQEMVKLNSGQNRYRNPYGQKLYLNH